MKFIALKTEDGAVKGKLTLYCRTLKVSRQGFYKYLANQDRPWKYQTLVDEMLAILAEDACNDTYGRKRMYQALLLRQRSGVHIPSERTVYRVMKEMGISHRPKRKPNGITKTERDARKSDDLLKRDFSADEPLKKCVTDITEIKARDGRLYISAIFDCFDSAVLGLAMDANMKAELCQRTLTNAAAAYPGLRGAIVHSDRGTQYTSELYRQTAARCGVRQSMNSAGGRCHDNARCESMWARMKTELIYDRCDTEKMTVEELKSLVGIAKDETDRLFRMEGRKQVSLLEKYGVSESEARQLCKDAGLLSPVYSFSDRNGCWFCPNAKLPELRHLYDYHPDLWDRMLELQAIPNKTTEKFNHTQRFSDIDELFRTRKKLA